jgi:hypothetical protein
LGLGVWRLGSVFYVLCSTFCVCVNSFPIYFHSCKFSVDDLEGRYFTKVLHLNNKKEQRAKSNRDLETEFAISRFSRKIYLCSLLKEPRWRNW